MPDWSAFRAQMTAGSPPDALCRACELLWTCSALPVDTMRERMTANVPDAATCTRVQDALSLVRNRLWREHGVDPFDLPQRMTVVTAIAEDRASAADRSLIAALETVTAAAQCALERFPTGVASPPDADLAMLQASTPPLEAALQAIGLIAPQPAGVSALRSAIDAFAQASEHWAEPAATQRAWWLGLGWWTVSRAERQLGHGRAARDAMVRAADWYDLADEPGDAATCRDEVVDIETRFAADFDRAADRAARELLAPQAPLDRVRSLVRMIGAVGGAGDAFEAARVADDAAAALADLGYPDPEHAFDAAIDAWIATAARELRGKVLLARLGMIAQCWAQVLGAWTSARLVSDPAGSARAERTLRGVQALGVELGAQAKRANVELAQRLEVWMPRAVAALAPAERDDTGGQIAGCNELDDDLYRLRVACNEGASAGQVARADALQARAAALGSPLHVVRAIVEKMYVLLALERAAEVPPLADLAVQSMLGARAPALAAFGTGHERELYLTAIEYHARALAALRQHAALFALLAPVIDDIESERARVSSPYQQSAFLTTRAGLYELAAAAAFRLGRFDDVLAIGELLKSRTALRSRASPAAPASVADLDARLRATDDALLRAAPGSAEAVALRDTRRWLGTVRAIARARGAARALPAMSVAALQSALAPDECAVWWLWIDAHAAIVIALRNDGIRPALVRLDAAGKAVLDDYVAAIRKLSEPHAPDPELPGRVAALVTDLGTRFLPPPVRAFMAGATRLVLCPHRSLHLVPFHAAPWPGGHVIEHFAVRYVPNCTSLLVPWERNTDGRVLAIGVGTFDGAALPPLPGAAAEATRVAAAHGDRADLVLDATRSQFTALPLASYRCVHLATHGSSVLDAQAVDDPLQSCVFLRDGPLNGFELATLPLRAELVVLAACYSGQRALAGRGLARLPGDDLFGLQGVLFEAGVASVLGALWQVADDVAEGILADFHRSYAAGAPTEVALQQAIVAHLRDARRPQDLFYWAPFFVSGLGKPGPRPALRIDTAHSMH